VQDDCDPYFDCLGDIYGEAQLDCEGNCAGTALIGDLNSDQYQNGTDVIEYVNGILGEDLTPVACNDIDQDGNLTVTDAALMAYCNYWNVYDHPPDSNAVHDHCNFPFVEIINPFDSVTFTIGALELGEGWMDIHVKNPNKKMLGYELRLSGVQITGVQNLYDPEAYPVTPEHAFGTGHLMCLSQTDSVIQRGPEYKALCRVYFINPEPTICIAEVIDVVNENYHNSLTFLENECASITGLGESALDQGVRVFPNPFTSNTTILYPATGKQVIVTLRDIQGRVIMEVIDRNGSGRIQIDGSGLAAGSYIYHLSGGMNATGKLVLEP
ncbi:MAG: T9SS type A sorting domain-containing protein, partial [Bacteroidota bacterium]|nr:T9SS type A sorting domain-containing protein [Bacteroidota bacterium]